jgi:hypothetical protein
VVRIVTTVTQNVTNSCVFMTDGHETSQVCSVLSSVFAAQYQYLKPLMSPSLSDDRFLGSEGVKPDLVLFCSKLSKSVKDLNRSLDGWM